MYRSGDCYNRIVQLAVNIYCDYQLTEFPINAKRLCERMGVRLIPYSAFDEINRKTLLSRSDYGFYVPMLEGFPPRIFYNDDPAIVGSEERIRFYLLHELKHYVNEDINSEADDDDLADYFAKFMACPIPFLVLLRIDTPDEIAARFGVSFTVAEITASNVRNRINKYGTKIFDYEKPLIQLLFSEFKLHDCIRGDEAYEQ